MNKKINPESVYDNERLVSIYDKQQLAPEQDIVYRLKERARIRRQIPGRKSVQENKPDRIADLLEEAAHEIVQLRDISKLLKQK
jgi:hypothetical protein